jgi:hypothetical protein
MTIMAGLQGGMLMLVQMLTISAAADAADCELIGDTKLVEHDYLLKNGRKKCPRMGTLG